MPTSYTSIFVGSRNITKQDLCALLNLDASKKLDVSDIIKAYRQRVKRFHPDKQSQYNNLAIPAILLALLILPETMLVKLKAKLFWVMFKQSSRW